MDSDAARNAICNLWRRGAAERARPGPQRVRNEGEEMRYDDAIPNGFHVIAIDADPEQHLDATLKIKLKNIHTTEES
jgi:hypothetical protein